MGHLCRPLPCPDIRTNILSEGAWQGTEGEKICVVVGTLTNDTRLLTALPKLTVSHQESVTELRQGPLARPDPWVFRTLYHRRGVRNDPELRVFFSHRQGDLIPRYIPTTSAWSPLWVTESVTELRQGSSQARTTSLLYPVPKARG